MTLLTKYRPKNFDQVIGHDDLIATFKRAKGHNRAFLIVGPTGVGKTTLARLFAADLGDNDPLEVDGATSNGVEDIEELTAPLKHHRLLGFVRVIIADECQRFSQAAWTALLKPIEETPDDVTWIFCTTDPAKVPDNIKSRCIELVLQPVSTNDIMDLLTVVCEEQGWKTPKEVRALCAQKALGLPRVALKFLAACYNCKDRDEAARAIGVQLDKDLTPEGLAFRLAQALAENDLRKCQSLFSKMRDKKESPEGARQVIRSYFTTVAEDGKNDERMLRYAWKVLAAFAEPLPDMPSLMLAVLDVILGGSNGQD